MIFRTGIGYDVHPLASSRPLWLGGILIPSEKGAVGHSDADVLIHAICDALLGAAALGDIGTHFPDNDPHFKNIDSKLLLKRVVDLLKVKGFGINNIDSTIILEKPKIACHIAMMQKTLSEILSIPTDCLSIKATTHEKLGTLGRGEGIAAIASVLIIK